MKLNLGNKGYPYVPLRELTSAMETGWSRNMKHNVYRGYQGMFARRWNAHAVLLMWEEYFDEAYPGR